jgi:hypothetical protein
MIAGLMASAVVPLSAQTWKVVTDPPTAQLYRIAPANQGGSGFVLIGTGTAEFKVKNGDPNTLVVLAEGYAEERHTFLKGEKQPKDKTFPVYLTRRIVSITALPFDAAIFVDGVAQPKLSFVLEVPQGQTLTIDLKKAGFATVRRVYHFERGGEQPPSADRLELKDRVVNLNAPTGAQILRDGVLLGENNVDVIVPLGGCTLARAEMRGWQPAEKRYCFKDGLPVPPISDNVLLTGRTVNVIAPPEAKVFVNQRQAGVGTVGVMVNEGLCVQVRVDQPGLVSETRQYCNQVNVVPPPPEDAVQLMLDDSYPASASTDQANLTVGIEVGKDRTEEAAWKIIAAVVSSSIEALELSDRETGYLRTAWLYKPFAGGRVVIRTRIIVTRQSTDPLRYNIKIASERNKTPGILTRDDENFEPWERLLASFKDIIVELQNRLK